MAKKQPLNNRINKEAMFKKIMPSASSRPKQAPPPAPAGGGDLLDDLTDDLIDRTVNSFGDDLLDQLPSQPRVFATPAAPTAPVPPPSTVSVPAFEGYAIGDEQRQLRDTAQEPAREPLEAPPAAEPEALPSLEAPPPQPAPRPPVQSPIPRQPEAPPYFPQQPQPYPFVPAQQAAPPPFPDYAPAQYPQGNAYYPPYPYPYPPYPFPQPDTSQPAPQPPAPTPPPPAESAPKTSPEGVPVIEQTASATVVADSASVVTDTVVIQENRMDDRQPREAAPQWEPKPAPHPVYEPEEPDEPPPHDFQEEMDLSAVAHLLDNYDAFPPLSEGDGDVVNVVERIVAVWLDEVIARVHGCPCEKCRMDMAAFALNRLQPQYLLAEELSEESFFHRRTVAETVRMLYRAAFQVKAQPRH